MMSKQVFVQVTSWWMVLLAVLLPTDVLLKQATDALDLAQSRYNLGLSSIVELSQAQLNSTEAQIAVASARYDYALQRAILDYQTGVLH
jgi:outer membrane protein